MFTITNLIKLILIAAAVSAGFNFYYASTAFQKAVGVHQNTDIGKIEAFFAAAESMQSSSEFWFHIFDGWLASFAMIFVGCGLLLLVIKIPNKRL